MSKASNLQGTGAGSAATRAMGSPRAIGGQDTTVLPREVDRALAERGRAMGGPLSFRVSDLLLNNYGGDKRAMAREYAAMSGTTYKNAYDNISRWLHFEAGTGTRQRDPNKNKKSLGSLKGLYAKKNTPRGTSMNFTITGWIGYEGRAGGAGMRYRTIRVRGVSGDKVFSALQSNNVKGAYDAIFNVYAPGAGLIAAEADNIDVEIS